MRLRSASDEPGRGGITIQGVFARMRNLATLLIFSFGANLCAFAVAVLATRSIMASRFTVDPIDISANISVLASAALVTCAAALAFKPQSRPFVLAVCSALLSGVFGCFLPYMSVLVDA